MNKDRVANKEEFDALIMRCQSAIYGLQYKLSESVQPPETYPAVLIWDAGDSIYGRTIMVYTVVELSDFSSSV